METFLVSLVILFKLNGFLQRATTFMTLFFSRQQSLSKMRSILRAINILFLMNLPPLRREGDRTERGRVVSNKNMCIHFYDVM